MIVENLDNLPIEKQSAIADIENLIISEDTKDLSDLGINEDERKEIRTNLVSLSLESDEDIQNVSNVLNSFLMIRKNKQGELESNNILQEHSAKFLLYFLRLYPHLKSLESRYGYHKLDYSNPENVGHIINHAMAGVTNLCMFRELALGQINLSEGQTKESVLREFISIGEDEDIDDSEVNELFKELSDEESFNSMVRNQILISLIHDIEEKSSEGRIGHERRAQRRAVELAKEGLFEPNRLTDIVTGIQGSLVTWDITPTFREDLVYYTTDKKEGETRDHSYFIKKEDLNSVRGRFLRTLTKVCDWEATASSELTETKVFDLIKEKNIKLTDKINKADLIQLTKLCSSQLHLSLVAESLQEESNINEEGNPPKTSVAFTVYKGNLVDYVKSVGSFFKNFAQRQSKSRDSLLDQWENTRPDNVDLQSFVRRFSHQTEEIKNRVDVFNSLVEKNPEFSILMSLMIQKLIQGNFEEFVNSMDSESTYSQLLKQNLPDWDTSNLQNSSL